MNDNPDANGSSVEGRDGFALTLSPGTGVTFYPNNNFILRRGYLIDCFIQFTDVISPAVTIIVTRCGYSGTSLYLAPKPSNNSFTKNTIDYLNYNSALLTGNLFWNVRNLSSTSNSYSYTTTDLKNQLIVRNPTGTANDIFGFILNPRYLNQIFTVQNPSAFTINIRGQTNIWNLIPTPITIPTHKQAIMSVTSSSPTISNAGSYYNYGVYNATGGTGSGMTVTIIELITTFTLTTGGLTYTDGDYTTMNLTTPSATGLVLYCQVDSETGRIIDVGDIKNYLNGGYHNGDIIQIIGGDGNARIQLNLVNSITGYFINTLGDGAYLSTDVLNISGSGTGSDAQITLGQFISIRLIGKFPL